jgi:ceramide glucosyltransferase
MAVAPASFDGRLKGTIVIWLSNFCLISSVLGCVWLAIALICMVRFARRPMSGCSEQPSVSILKPLHGDERKLFERLASFCGQAYDGAVQVIFGLQDPADPAAQVARRIKTKFPGQPITLAIEARQHGANRKVSNLTNMVASARHQVILISDSDIEVGPAHLAKVVGELQRPGVGAVTCLYHGVGDTGIWARLGALAINTHFLPNVVAALSFGLARPCFGSTIAIRRETLDRIGGLRAFADDLADDYALGEAVRNAGLEVAILPFSIAHACNEASLRDLFLRELRWARTIKAIAPLGYMGSVISHPLPLALLAAVGGSPGAFELILVAIACRIGLCLCVECAFGLAHHSFWLLPLRDLLSFAVFVASFFGAEISWKGHTYRMIRGSILAHDRSAPAP